MAVRRIVQAAEAKGPADEDLMLRTSTELAQWDTDEALAVIIDLLDTKRHFEALCVGLAATQIGSSLRIAVVQSTRGDLVMINPQVLASSGKKDVKRESCMSIWGFTAPVERREKVEISYTDEHGVSQIERFAGFTARVIQHEVDHLDGILFSSRANQPLTTTDIFEGRSPDG